MYAQWSAQNFSEYYRQSLTKKEAKQVLPDSPADGVPPSGTYLARDKGSQWVEKRCPGSTVERLCHLPQHDITGSASFGRYFVFGTTRGMYWLDFPPETFDITSTTVYTDSYMFDSDSDSDSD
ncbi:hypothetical protein FRC03_007516 [Tulasnella sp. 419]|nr:hypothetical protein FRC03_007516 [Tulasnella sp. 419]